PVSEFLGASEGHERHSYSHTYRFDSSQSASTHASPRLNATQSAVPGVPSGSPAAKAENETVGPVTQANDDASRRAPIQNSTLNRRASNACSSSVSMTARWPPASSHSVRAASQFFPAVRRR